MVAYATEKTSLDLTSLVVICLLMTFFHFFPLAGPDGANRLVPSRLLEGFANPARGKKWKKVISRQGVRRTRPLMRSAAAALSSRVTACGRSDRRPLSFPQSPFSPGRPRPATP